MYVVLFQGLKWNNFELVYTSYKETINYKVISCWMFLNDFEVYILFKKYTFHQMKVQLFKFYKNYDWL